MSQSELLSVFFLLGKSPKELEFLEDDWEDEHEKETNLSWNQFMDLHEQGLWGLNDQAIEKFSASFSAFKGFEKVKDVYEAISADSEDWNDFLDYVVNADDFDELWSESWLTRYDMDSSLSEFCSKNEDSATKIEALRGQFHAWFDDEEKIKFKENLVRMLTPLQLAIKHIQK